MSKINTEINTLPTGNARSSEGKGCTNQDVQHTAKSLEKIVFRLKLVEKDARTYFFLEKKIVKEDFL